MKQILHWLRGFCLW